MSSKQANCSVVSVTVLSTAGATWKSWYGCPCKQDFMHPQGLTVPKLLLKAPAGGGHVAGVCLSIPCWVPCLPLAAARRGRGSDSELPRCPVGLIDGHSEHNGVLQYTCRAVLHLTPSQTCLTCLGGHQSRVGPYGHRALVLGRPQHYDSPPQLMVQGQCQTQGL